jgi:serine phosphatase RsbU (regulator of sigma subunit)
MAALPAYGQAADMVEPVGFVEADGAAAGGPALGVDEEPEEGTVGVGDRSQVIYDLVSESYLVTSYDNTRRRAPSQTDAPFNRLFRHDLRADLPFVVFADTDSVDGLSQREGLRYSSAHAEIRLAREIHATLVPDVSGRDQGLTWRGRSRPSGDVGGDLVDVVENPRGWCATVADVSGHGVAAGVLMGMFKTAFRAVLSDARDIAEVATRVNRVISPLRQPNMFITTACLRQVAPGRFEYVLAGHPPMLHISRGGASSTWVGTSQLALGLLDGTVYASGTVAIEPGDVLVLVTDGLIEVFDRADRELGLDGLQAAATTAARTGSLAEIEQAIFAASAAHGAQLDDQTTLLVRRG